MNLNLIKNRELSSMADCAKANAVRIYCGLKDFGSEAENKASTKQWLWGNPSDNSKGIIAIANMMYGIDYVGQKGTADVTLSRSGISKALASTHKESAEEKVKQFLDELNNASRAIALQTMTPEQMQIVEDLDCRIAVMQQDLDKKDQELDKKNEILHSIHENNKVMEIEEFLRSTWTYDGFKCNCGYNTLLSVAKDLKILDGRCKSRARINTPYQMFCAVSESDHYITTRFQWSEDAYNTIRRMANPVVNPQLYTELTPSLNGYTEALANIVSRAKKKVQEPSNELAKLMGNVKALIASAPNFKHKRKPTKHKKI